MTAESTTPVELAATTSEVSETAAVSAADRASDKSALATKLPRWLLWLVPALLVTGLAIRGAAVVSYSWKSAERSEEDLFADFDADGDDAPAGIVFGDAVSMSPGEPDSQHSGLNRAADIAMPGAFPELTPPGTPGRLQWNDASVTTTGAAIASGRPAGSEFTTALATAAGLNQPVSNQGTLEDDAAPVWLEGRIEFVDEPDLKFSEFPSLPFPSLPPPNLAP